MAALCFPSSSYSSTAAAFRTLTSPPFSSSSSSSPLLRRPFPNSPSAPRALKPLLASRRPQKGTVVVVRDRGSWREAQNFGVERVYESDDEDDEEEEEEEDDDDDRSLDLLVRFLHNVFRKVSRRARKAVRSVLPVPIPTRLVKFAVNGVLVLASVWIVKALLEVVCTIGTTVFVSILVLRAVWFGLGYIQETRWDLGNRFDNDDDAWSGVQPAT